MTSQCMDPVEYRETSDLVRERRAKLLIGDLPRMNHVEQGEFISAIGGEDEGRDAYDAGWIALAAGNDAEALTLFRAALRHAADAWVSS